jgi:hypothetical protein
VLSLRELMLLVAVVALGTAALFLGGWTATAFLLFVLLLVTSLAIVACAGDGKTQVFALGFVVSAITYPLACLFFVTSLGGNLATEVPAHKAFTWSGLQSFLPPTCQKTHDEP